MRYGIWETNIQTEALVAIGRLLFSTNNINTNILKRRYPSSLKTSQSD